jgi:phosphatidate cytidylyltransferase
MLQRTVSILVGAPVFLVLLIWSGWSCTFMVGVLALVSLGEFYGACRRTGAAPASGYGYGAALVLLGSAVPLLDPPGLTQEPALFPGPTCAAFFCFGLTLLVVASMVAELGRADRAPLKNLAPTWFGVVYVGWLFPFVARLRWLGGADLLRLGWSGAAQPGWVTAVEPGAWLLVHLVLATWAVDTGALLVGKTAGGPKLAPVLSPGKTWSGSLGGFFGAVLVAAAVGWLLGFSLAWSLVMGALVGVTAQLGDLCKSAIKREIGIKDFGTVIPGHGGVLDRFDSLLFSAPTVYFLWMLWPGR